MTCILGKNSHRERVSEGSLFQSKQKTKQPVECLTEPREVRLLYPAFLFSFGSRHGSCVLELNCIAGNRIALHPVYQYH